MKANCQQPLELQIKPSRLLNVTLIVVHLLALLAVWLSAVAMLVQVSITALIFYSLYRLCQGKSDLDRSFCLLHSVGEGWQVAELDLNYQTMMILPSTVISPWLTVIHYHTETSKRQSLVVIKDSLTPEQYRQLIVKLKVVGVG